MLEKYFKNMGVNPEGEVTREEREKIIEGQKKLASEKPEDESEEERMNRTRNEVLDVTDPYGKEASPLSRILAGSRDPKDIEDVRQRMSEKTRKIFDEKMKGE